MCMQCLKEPEEGIEPPTTLVSCLSCGCWEFELRSFGRSTSALPADPSLQPQGFLLDVGELKDMKLNVLYSSILR